VPDDNIKTTHGKANRAVRDRHEESGDFTTTLRVVPSSCLAMLIGALCTFVALVLLRLTGLFETQEAVRTLKKISFPHIRRPLVKCTNHRLKLADNAYYLGRESYR
jgi:hypothetical protein